MATSLKKRRWPRMHRAAITRRREPRAGRQAGGTQTQPRRGRGSAPGLEARLAALPTTKEDGMLTVIAAGLIVGSLIVAAKRSYAEAAIMACLASMLASIA